MGRGEKRRRGGQQGKGADGKERRAMGKRGREMRRTMGKGRQERRWGRESRRKEDGVKKREGGRGWEEKKVAIGKWDWKGRGWWVRESRRGGRGEGEQRGTGP